ncbi:MAG: DsbA family protein [Gemmatimonadota bacterium]
MDTALPVECFFDFTDPLSYLLHQSLSPHEEGGEVAVRWVPVELRPPPRPMLSPRDPGWASRWQEALSASDPGELREPLLLPWTRKAHELVLYGSEHGLDAALRAALFRAFWKEGADIGRIDVLVALATELGLDRTEAKATLDVDRYTARVAEGARRAREMDVHRIPTLVRGAARLEGFHSRPAVGTFLFGS